MKKTLLALALLGASSTAMADSWIYGGASVGQSDYEGKNSTSYTLHVGTGILPFIGLEAGYVEHGDFDLGANYELSATSLYFAAKPSIDFGPLHVYAKGGLHSWDKERNGSKFDDGIDIMYGVGAEYFIMGPISVGASYMNYTMDNTDAGTFSFNATFHFL